MCEGKREPVGARFATRPNHACRRHRILADDNRFSYWKRQYIISGHACRRFTGLAYILRRLRHPHEPSSRPPGRPSPGEVVAGGHGSARSERKGPPREKVRLELTSSEGKSEGAAKRGEPSHFPSDDDMNLGILHTFIVAYIFS